MLYQNSYNLMKGRIWMMDLAFIKEWWNDITFCVYYLHNAISLAEPIW